MTELLILAALLILIQSIHESNTVYENTKSLILEQIDLTAKKLDGYRLIKQGPYIAKTLYHLNKINGVNIFDSNCKLTNKRPRNFQVNWDCESELPKDIVIYNADTSISYSNGAPKYILAKIDMNKISFFDVNGLIVMFLSLLLIVCTIFGLNYLIKKRILTPLNNLKNIIGKSGNLERENNSSILLPVELTPIHENVLLRDEIINQNKIELLKQNEVQIKNEMSQDFAHNIRSPIMILRDYFLSKELSYENSATLIEAIDDLDQISKQLYEGSVEYARNVNIIDLINSIIKMKEIEFKNNTPKVSIKLDATEKSINVCINPTRFKFVLSNILNNAKEASHTKKECKVLISIFSQDSLVSIKIKDNGKGIKKNDLEKLFSRGVSINKPGGTGLGLYYAKKVMNKENGSIKISSKFSKGTTIDLVLPIVESTFMFNGVRPFKNVFIEDYKLNQMSWHDKAIEKDLSVAIFSSPAEFLKNIDSIDKKANIFLDSHFPDFAEKGEDWAKKLPKLGFDKIFICSSSDVDLSKKPWISGSSDKHRPFELKENPS